MPLSPNAAGGWSFLIDENTTRSLVSALRMQGIPLNMSWRWAYKVILIQTFSLSLWPINKHSLQLILISLMSHVIHLHTLVF